MTTEQQRVISALRLADITETDWEYGILNSITDRYVRGYLNGRVEGHRDLDLNSEDGRELLIEWAGYNIWT